MELDKLSATDRVFLDIEGRRPDEMHTSAR